jgi:hypothetical protein
VRESRTPGSVRGVPSNGHPYRVNSCIAAARNIKLNDSKGSKVIVRRRAAFGQKRAAVTDRCSAGS